MFRIVVVRQANPDDVIFSSGSDIYAPVGSTRGIKVLWDKMVPLNNLADDNGVTVRMFDKWIRLNSMLEFEGDQTDGTDTDRGTIVLYHLSDSTVGAIHKGSATTHYRELV